MTNGPSICVSNACRVDFQLFMHTHSGAGLCGPVTYCPCVLIHGQVLPFMETVLSCPRLAWFHLWMDIIPCFLSTLIMGFTSSVDWQFHGYSRTFIHGHDRICWYTICDCHIILINWHGIICWRTLSLTVQAHLFTGISPILMDRIPGQPHTLIHEPDFVDKHNSWFSKHAWHRVLTLSAGRHSSQYVSSPIHGHNFICW